MKRNSPFIKNSLLAFIPAASVALAGMPASAAEYTGASSSITPYVQSSVFDITAIRSVEDGTGFGLPQMIGIPDGLGAFDNEDGTFTVLMNHELNTGQGAVQDHGANSAFVSRWVINKSDFSVVSIADQIQQVSVWDTGTSSFLAPASGPSYQFTRLCSADLPVQSAFQYGGLGTANRIFMDGEESGTEGRAFAHILTGPSAGTSYQLPHLGRFSWENSVANPNAQQKTIVMGMDDNANNGQVYMYVGNKQSTGNDIEKAGLTGGSLYAVKVAGATNDTTTGLGINSAFTLVNHGNVANQTGVQVNTDSVNGGAFNFNRPEDGTWDPRVGHENEFYFVTTAGATTASRLYKLTFTDINNPELGGSITCLLDGSEGQVMMDNISVGRDGTIMIQEDPGGNNRFSKIWQYDIATDTLTEAAAFKDSLFAPAPGADPFNNDEESSGIIDISEIVGYRAYLADAQVHTLANTNSFVGAVEHGQLFILSQVPEPSTVALFGVGILAVVNWTRMRRKA